MYRRNQRLFEVVTGVARTQQPENEGSNREAKKRTAPGLNRAPNREALHAAISIGLCTVQ